MIGYIGVSFPDVQDCTYAEVVSMYTGRRMEDWKRTAHELFQIHLVGCSVTASAGVKPHVIDASKFDPYSQFDGSADPTKMKLTSKNIDVLRTIAEAIL